LEDPLHGLKMLFKRLSLKVFIDLHFFIVFKKETKIEINEINHFGVLNKLRKVPKSMH